MVQRGVFILVNLVFSIVVNSVLAADDEKKTKKSDAALLAETAALHRQNKRLVRWVAKGEWMVGFEACERCGLFNNRLQCFDYSDDKQYLRLLFHPSTTLFADRVPRCKVIRSDMDEHKDDLSMVVTETFDSLQSDV